MHKALASLLVVAALGVAGAHAETTVVMDGVHNCCKGCARGIEKAVADLKDVSVAIEGETVTITSRTGSNARKAVKAVMEAGYYGAIEGAEQELSDKVLKGATVENVHLCCGKCVKTMTAAVESVEGVTGATIENKATSFTVEGEFKEGDLIAAINAAGFHGSVK